MQSHGSREGAGVARRILPNLGVDLATIPGISVLHVQTILAELGSDLSKFRSASAFSSWMGLCPDNDISGGKVCSGAAHEK